MKKTTLFKLILFLIIYNSFAPIELYGQKVLTNFKSNFIDSTYLEPLGVYNNTPYFINSFSQICKFDEIHNKYEQVFQLPYLAKDVQKFFFKDSVIVFIGINVIYKYGFKNNSVEEITKFHDRGFFYSSGSKIFFQTQYYENKLYELDENKKELKLIFENFSNIQNPNDGNSFAFVIKDKKNQNNTNIAFLKDGKFSELFAFNFTVENNLSFFEDKNIKILYSYKGEKTYVFNGNNFKQINLKTDKKIYEVKYIVNNVNEIFLMALIFDINEVVLFKMKNDQFDEIKSTQLKSFYLGGLGNKLSNILIKNDTLSFVTFLIENSKHLQYLTSIDTTDFIGKNYELPDQKGFSYGSLNIYNKGKIIYSPDYTLLYNKTNVWAFENGVFNKLNNFEAFLNDNNNSYQDANYSISKYAIVNKKNKLVKELPKFNFLSSFHDLQLVWKNKKYALIKSNNKESIMLLLFDGLKIDTISHALMSKEFIHFDVVLLQNPLHFIIESTNSITSRYSYFSFSINDKKIEFLIESGERIYYFNELSDKNISFSANKNLYLFTFTDNKLIDFSKFGITDLNYIQYIYENGSLLFGGINSKFISNKNVIIALNTSNEGQLGLNLSFLQKNYYYRNNNAFYQINQEGIKTELLKASKGYSFSFFSNKISNFESLIFSYPDIYYLNSERNIFRKMLFKASSGIVTKKGNSLLICQENGGVVLFNTLNYSEKIIKEKSAGTYDEISMKVNNPGSILLEIAKESKYELLQITADSITDFSFINKGIKSRHFLPQYELPKYLPFTELDSYSILNTNTMKMTKFFIPSSEDYYYSLGDIYRNRYFVLNKFSFRKVSPMWNPQMLGYLVLDIENVSKKIEFTDSKIFKVNEEIGFSSSYDLNSKLQFHIFNAKKGFETENFTINNIKLSHDDNFVMSLNNKIYYSGKDEKYNSQIYELLINLEDEEKVPEESKKSNFEIIMYPNPSSKRLNFSTDNMFISNITILDEKGSLIKQIKPDLTNSIDVENLTEGAYYIVLHVDDKIITKRFLKH